MSPLPLLLTIGQKGWKLSGLYKNVQAYPPDNLAAKRDYPRGIHGFGCTLYHAAIAMRTTSPMQSR